MSYREERFEDVIYLRKSQADLDMEKIQKFETLERHRKHLLGVAEEKGLNVTKIYKEIVSGDSIQDRPEFKKLLNDLRKNKYRSVLVMEIQRLGRGDTKDQGTIFEILKMSGTKIVTPDKTYDPDNEADSEYLEFFLFMSRKEYKFITKRMQRGRIDAIKEGQYFSGTPPYGYDAVRHDKKHKTLVPNEFADNVRLMFEWMKNERVSNGEIGRRFKRMGVRTPRGNVDWDRSTIKEILRNPAYMGKVAWYKRRQIKEFKGTDTVKVSRRMPQEDFLLVDGQHEALITEETYYAVQKLLDQRFMPPAVFTRITNPLAGIIRCSECGRTMRRQADPRRKSPTKRTGRLVHADSHSCKTFKSCFLDDVMAKIKESLKENIKDFEIELSERNTEVEKERFLAIRKQLKSNIEKLENRKKKVMIAFEDGIYTGQEASQRKTEITEEILELQEELNGLQPPSEDDLKDKIVRFTHVLDTIDLPTITPAMVNQLLKGIIEKIIYTRTGDEIHLDIHLRE